MAIAKPGNAFLGIGWDLWLIYANVAFYAMCYMAQVPVMPYLVKSLGAEATAYGQLQTAFGVVQMLGGLLSGPLMDRYGSKLLFCLSFASSAVAYALVAVANSMPLLYISKMPMLFQHAVLAARAMVTDRSDPQHRARMLGYVGVSYGIGFAIGPSLGGLLSKNSLQRAAWAAAVGSVASCSMVWMLLPADAPAAAAACSGKTAGSTQLGDLLLVLREPEVAFLLVVKMVAGVALALFQSSFVLVLQQVFGLDPSKNGLILSFVGVIVILGQAVVVGWLTRNLSELATTRLCCAIMAVCFFAYAACVRLWHVLVVLVPLSIAGVVLATVNTAQLTKAVLPSKTGSVIALDMAIGSGIRIVTPSLGTFLLEKAGFPSLGTIAGIVLAALFAVLQSGLFASRVKQE